MWGGGGTMLFHAFRVVYSVKELDSRTKFQKSVSVPKVSLPGPF